MNEETRGGLNADCMRYLGKTLAQAVAHFGWGAIIDFAAHLPQESATWLAVNSDRASFASRFGSSAILADIYDAISALAYMYAKRNGGTASKPKGYPRPWRDAGERFGSDPIPISDFDDWYYGGDD